MTVGSAALPRPAPIEPAALWCGASWIYRLQLKTAAGQPLSLAGSMVVWRLVRAGELILGDLTVGFGLAFEDGDPGSGVLLVNLTPAQTAAIGPGTAVQEWEITTAAGDTLLERGAVYFHPAGAGEVA